MAAPPAAAPTVTPVVKAFAELYAALDATTRTTGKVAALRDYFASADPADAAWAVWFLTGNRPKSVAPAGKLRAWAAEFVGLPGWLFGESYDAVGDLAETIALLLPGPVEGTPQRGLAAWVEGTLLPLRSMDEPARREALHAAWRTLDPSSAFVWNKLVTGAFRVGVSAGLVMRAVAAVAGLPTDVIAGRLAGTWDPAPETWRRLVSPDAVDADRSRPHPFCLASPLSGEDRDEDDVDGHGGTGGATEGNDPREDPPSAPASAPPLPLHLGPVTDWQAEWKWDGIRIQLVRRAGQAWLWSRGEEAVTDRFPEVAAMAGRLPEGTVLDGELLVWRDGRPAPFAALQKRIGRKSPGRKVLADLPVVMVAYDVLEVDGRDVRGEALSARRAMLERLVAETADPRLQASPVVAAADWAGLARQRAGSRARGVEGLMLKRLSSPYRTGRVRGDWWKWKVDPFTVDAVLMYAQRGHGRRAGLFSDYTFGVWDRDPTERVAGPVAGTGPEAGNDGSGADAAGTDGGVGQAGTAAKLVTFAKAYSGLTDAEIREVDRFIRANTVDRFGPVSVVRAEMVFELGFEAINRSSRHKCGLAVRFPRMLRIRTDKRAEEADTLGRIAAMLPPE